jgi:hypothetical protein
MAHPTHEFASMDFHGASISACKFCGAQTTSASAGEPCRNNPAFQVTTLPEAALPAMGNLMPTQTLRELIASLSSENIRKRLEEVEGEAAALRVLLQAAEAKEKKL